MWIYKILLCVAVLVYSETKRHALQDYQKTDAVHLVTPPDVSYMSKGRKMSVGKCARRCSRNRKLQFTCRAFNFDQKTAKCHLLSYDSLTVGVRTENDFNFDLYEKKDFMRECIIGNGLNYKGKRSVTKSGVQCQLWNSKTPHEHNFLPQRHKHRDLRDNLCRNPDNTTTGPWCFTTDPRIRHQECSIPQCSEGESKKMECMTCNGESYRGPLDHTESGRECQRWDLDEPHKHLFHPKRYPDKGLKDNYCRNPDGRQRPWCFTTDPSTPWEYCNIKQCDSDNGGDIDNTTTCFRGRGEGYRGTVGITPDGVTCQRWDAQFPHRHSYTPQNYRCKDLRENYCRNPDGRHLPWCFTTDPSVPVAFCTNIPRCGDTLSEPEECYMGIGDTYNGKRAKTRSGIPCAPWKDHRESNERDVDLLMAEQAGNFCRNPDKDKHGPWCYTNSSSIPWDYCSLKPCEPSHNNLPQKDEGTKTSCFVHKQVRIVGGGPVLIKEGTWMVSIQKGSTHWCGGSLVREEWVLTDRQCFSSCVPDLSEYIVWLGISHLNESGENDFHRQERRISHVICGPEGSSLALLRLTQPALPRERVRIIQLPVADCSIQEDTICSVYGWGETKDTGHEGTLKRVHLPIVSNERCQQLHEETIPITSSKLCAGGRRDEGVCEKDYGGPLVCQESNSKVIVGVSINGRGCARRNRPAIFVNVAFYTGWIHKVFRNYPNSELNN
ncbi:hepatocyte growth factor isoform X1 [Onychostoma macrolepis]|uniref:hepatocyte growth factor isoform X1 n=1 Tax=Onychostoma macrolepis TaxID=369639 RepID=UPI00272CBA85|nr:hepatocyte growth factor isoform X1 [Onychostoma macrolepis]